MPPRPSREVKGGMSRSRKGTDPSKESRFVFTVRAREVLERIEVVEGSREKEKAKNARRMRCMTYVLECFHITQTAYSFNASWVHAWGGVLTVR